jgi:hypothetical protein
LLPLFILTAVSGDNLNSQPNLSVFNNNLTFGVIEMELILSINLITFWAKGDEVIGFDNKLLLSNAKTALDIAIITNNINKGRLNISTYIFVIRRVKLAPHPFFYENGNHKL